MIILAFDAVVFHLSCVINIIVSAQVRETVNHETNRLDFVPIPVSLLEVLAIFSANLLVCFE